MPRQQHCNGAKMASSEFVRLFKDTPGAVAGGEKRSGRNRTAHGFTSKPIKTNDLELIFAKKKEHGEKNISFATFLVCGCVN